MSSKNVWYIKEVKVTRTNILIKNILHKYTQQRVHILHVTHTSLTYIFFKLFFGMRFALDFFFFHSSFPHVTSFCFFCGQYAVKNSLISKVSNAMFIF